MDYMKRHAESNETVRRRWFPGQASLFHDDFSMYPESAAVSLTLRDCAHVIAELAREGAVDPPDDKDDVDAAADEDA